MLRPVERLSARLTGTRAAAELAPRESGEVQQQRDKSVELVGIAQSAEAGGGFGQGAPHGQLAESVVARVSGDVILVREVLDPIRATLMEAEKSLGPDKFAAYREQLFRQQLRNIIDRKLLVQEAKRVLPEAGYKQLEAMAEQDFDRLVREQMAEVGAATREELACKMRASGQSFEMLRRTHTETFIAQQFLRLQIAPRLTISRQDLLDYYATHREQFRRPARVRWHEIVISYGKHGGHDAARAKADQLLKQLRDGADFETLAKRYSDGATAFQGGKWDWTNKGSYVVAAVDEALFSLPIGKVSDPIEGPRGWHIVRVDERTEPGVISFLEAQEQIANELRKQRFVEESRKYMQQLFARANVATLFSSPTQIAGRPAARDRF